MHMKNKLPRLRVNPRTMLPAAVVLKAQLRTLFSYELSMVLTSVIDVPGQCIVNPTTRARRPQKLLCLVRGNWTEAFTVLQNTLADCAGFRALSVLKMFTYKEGKSCLILG